MAMNAATAYKDSKILTASPQERTLLLYEGAIKFCNIAMMAMEKNDIMKASQNIIKTEKIIIEFRSTLDFKYPIAQDFDVIYDYIYRRLVDANVKKDITILQEALDYIRQMRDTWKEAMMLSKTAK